MVGYHGNNAPQCEAQADTVVLKVAMVNQDEGRLEEGKEDQSGLGKGGRGGEVGGREGGRRRNNITLIFPSAPKLLISPTLWTTSLFPLNSMQLVYTKAAVK